MEHSMSGGVIKQYESKTLVKTQSEQGVIVWYTCSLPVFEDDFVLAGGEKRRVLQVVHGVTANASPVPFHTVKEVDQVLFDED